MLRPLKYVHPISLNKQKHEKISLRNFNSYLFKHLDPLIYIMWIFQNYLSISCTYSYLKKTIIDTVDLAKRYLEVVNVFPPLWDNLPLERGVILFVNVHVDMSPVIASEQLQNLGLCRAPLTIKRDLSCHAYSERSLNIKCIS